MHFLVMNQPANMDQPANMEYVSCIPASMHASNDIKRKITIWRSTMQQSSLH
jgi:hypothetical protein